MSDQNRKEAPGYIKGLDGLRACAVLMVLIAHAGYGHIIPGGFGVTLFFAISGYLITRLLLTELQETNRIALGKFYIRRFLRLYPELLVLIALCLIVGAILDFQSTIVEKLAVLAYFMNYYYVFGAHYLEGSYPWRQLWSLAVEEHFYLFFPAMLFFTRRRPRLQLSLTVFLIVMPLIWRPIAYYILQLPWQYNYVATETRIDSIAWGCLLALLVHGPLAKNWNFAAAPRVAIPAVALALFLLVLTFLIRSEDFRWNWRFSIQGFALLILFFNLMYVPIWTFAVDLLELPVLRFLGRISYALYLYHMLVNVLLEEYVHGLSIPAFMLLSLAVNIAIAAVSFRLVEIPVRPLRRKMGSHVK